MGSEETIGVVELNMGLLSHQDESVDILATVSENVEKNLIIEHLVKIIYAMFDIC